ncbi:hypothetical protein [Micromonospora sp. C28ISP2-4]|uniref:hypothetical protein n=1 Tax=Micromonospora sp. C28ISP2-4 TaxID=3059523 RepID=UPI00267561D2|nr:hypothetical protein [Micromonospora sp. C28ISP2-4]MDO3687370.1 hypothetical protein [Micromonospora sp. C28ISP2-4]
MRVTVDTDTDSFEQAVATVYAAYGKEFEWKGGEATTAPTQKVPHGSGSSILPGGWTEKKLRKWASYLQEDAQHVVRYVAAHGPEVSYDDVQDFLGKLRGLTGPVDGKVLGGAMSSGGHALKYIPGVNSQPIDRDHARRLYVIDTRFATVLADELGVPEEV